MIGSPYTSIIQNQLAHFAAQDDFESILFTAFGDLFDDTQTLGLRQQWLTGDFSVIPPIEVLVNGELAGAKGAYAAELDKIFISSDFLATASAESIAAVLLEEVGHRIDRLLNGAVDSAGDEGKIFSLLVNGVQLSPEMLAALQVQNDHAVISVDGKSIAVEEAGVVQIYGTSNNDTLRGNSAGTSYEIYGLAGNDDISISNSAADSILYGGSGNDFIVGGSGDDFIDGGSGNDTLYGLEGNDFIAGGSGDDRIVGGIIGNKRIYGNDGDDNLSGGYDKDTLYGGLDNDTLRGYRGDDQLYGESGNDLLYGDDGDDTLYGDEGNNTLYGGADNDQLFGGLDHDTLYGGDGDDTLSASIDSDNGILLYGDAGDDLLNGSKNDDTMDGGLGDDTLQGQAGNDTLDGKEGDDRITGGEGDDTILGGAGNDYLVGELYFGDSIPGGNDSIVGGEGSDSLFGGSGNDSLFGDAGDDLLNGEAGDDYLYGGSGINSLSGGDGNDYLQGGSDRDTLLGGNGNDLIEGGAGADLIEGNAGNDTLRGGSGSDVYTIREGISGATEIEDESGVDRLAIFAPGIVGLATLDINTDIRKSGNNLLVDLNGDKRFDASNDLTIKNFFGSGAIGAGFIESINNLTGASIIEKFRLSANSVTKETDGNTDLVIINGKYVAVDAITNELITVTYADEIVGVNSFPNWSVIAAEKASNGDMQYLWKHTSGQFWYSTSNSTGKAVSSFDILPYEAIFQQDLNGNGVIYPVIENAGNTQLSLNTSGKYVASNGTVILDILYNNKVVGENSYTGWKIVGAEINETNDNVAVVWKSTADQYWYNTNTDKGGLVSNIAIHESTFFQNFNSDDVIGSSIEFAGTTTLTVKPNGDYRAFSNDIEYAVQYDGANIGINSATGWAVIGAEVVGTEVKAVWKSDSGLFWYSTNTDKGGIVTDVDIAKYEFEFQQDFNKDGFISQIGTANNDTLGGSSANQLLTGGAGIDTFILKATNNGIDKITDFAANEFLDVSSFGLTTFTNSNLQIFTGTGTPFGTSPQQFILDSNTGDLYFDYVGGFANKLATLQGVTSLTAANFKI